MSLMSDDVDLKASAGDGIATAGEDGMEQLSDELSGEVGGVAKDLVQLEPSEDEMERERLISRYEQLQDEIARLGNELMEKEAELAEVKKVLGITPFTEFKQSVSNSFKVVGNKWKEVQDTDTFKKIDSTFTGWKSKVEDSDRYQKTVSSFNEGGKKVSGGISSAGTKIKESETLKTVGEKTSSALKRTGTVIKDTGTAIKENETIRSVGSRISGAATSLKERVWTSSDNTDGSVPNDDTPTKGETVIPDEPSKE